jgi:hypothetical protein
MQSLPNKAIMQKIRQTRPDEKDIVADYARLVIRYGMHCVGT